MRLSERDVKTNINSEIHASLRRLEDANYISETIQDEKLSTLANQVESKISVINSKISKLNDEVYQLHSYIEPHIYNEDLQFFQTAYIGNIQVSEGGSIAGNVTIATGGYLTVDGSLIANEGVDIYGNSGLFTPKITFPDEKDYTPHTLSICGTTLTDKILASKDLEVFEDYGPHTLTIEGTTLSGNILATKNLSFSLAGLVEGSSSGNNLTIRTKTNHVSLMGILVTPQIQYDDSTHKYSSWAVLTDQQGNILLMSSKNWSGTEAYEDGEDSVTPRPPYSTTFSYFETVNGEHHYKRTGGREFGTTTRVVYWG